MVREADLQACAAKLLDPAGCDDPYPLYRKLRDAGAPCWVPAGRGEGQWLLTRYQDVAACLKQSRASTNPRSMGPVGERPPIDGSMLLQDAPHHTRLRGLVSQAFTPARVMVLESRITEIAGELISHLIPGREFDFMTAFAEPLPVIVIAELLGIPPDERQMFCAWSSRLVAGTGMAASPAELLLMREASDNLARYLSDLIAHRRQHPKEDLISSLVGARDQEGRLSETELLGTCVLLLMAGNETTVNLLGNGMLTLLRHPEQLEWLRRNPEELPSAMEEMLRYESPVQRALLRVATDTITIGDTEIEVGQRISAVLGAANRDPSHFPDPDRFDPLRTPNRHLAFGAGMHFCLGALLARAEARIGFRQILERLPTIRLVSGPQQWRQHPMFRGLHHLRLVT